MSYFRCFIDKITTTGTKISINSRSNQRASYSSLGVYDHQTCKLQSTCNQTDWVPKQTCDQIVRKKNDFNYIIMPTFKKWEEFTN